MKRAPFLSLFFITALLRADVIEVYPTEDTTVIVDELNDEKKLFKNWGGRDQLFGSFYYSAVEPGVGEYALLRFDASQLPAKGAITSAKLKITNARPIPFGPDVNPMLRVWQMAAANKGWIQGVSNGTCDTGATGFYLDQSGYNDNESHSGTKWASGGPFNSNESDLSQELGALPLVGGAGDVDQVLEIDLDPQAIAQWREEPELAAAGLVVHMETSARAVNWILFHSSRAEVPKALLPHLEITWQAAP